ncbi:cycle-inhibiting factor [Pseudomonas sp. SDO528_S397]
MRNILNAFRSSQPDPHLQTQNSKPSRTSRTSATASSSRSVNNPSTRMVQDFAQLSAKNLRANVLLNNEDNSIPIHHKSPSALLKAIDDNISQTAQEWEMPRHEVEVMLGSSKRIREPVCGITANNVAKLFLDTDSFSYAFERGQTISLPQLQQQLANLPAHKNFILRVNDRGLGHAYVIDLPASANPRRDAFIYQSDLGEGATRPLYLNDWMNKKASHPVSLNDINTHFMNMSQGRIDPEHIAKLFDIDGDPKMLRPERLDLRKNHGFNFQFSEYDPANLERNITEIKTRCG